MKTQRLSPFAALRRTAVVRALVFAVAASLGGLAPMGHAASLVWTSTGDGTFSDAANWNPSQAPVAGDNTVFTNSASYTVTFTADALNMNSNYFSGKSGTVTLDLGAFTWGLTNASASGGRGAFVVGQGAGSTAAVVLASGSLVVTNAANTARLLVGGNGIGSFFITNGSVRANLTSLGDASTGRGTLVLSGTGVIYTNTSDLKLAGSSGSSLTASNGAVLQVGGALNVGSSSSAGNSMLINNAALRIGGALTLGSSSANNSMLIAGSNALVTLVGESFVGSSVGSSAANNSLVISNGGQLTSGNVKIGYSTTAGSSLASSNTVTVVGAGSVWNAGNVYVGADGASSSPMSNVLFISEGAKVVATRMYVGTSTGGSNLVLVTSGGILDAPGSTLNLTVNTAAGNAISNDGGVFQFNNIAPAIAPNGFGRITLNHGTISFRGINAANVQGSLGGSTLTNILFSGANTFRLNNASNTSAATAQNYTFGYSSANPSNYAGLEMVNGGTAWRSAWLAISNNGSLLISNTTASIQGVLSNSGTIRVVNASATFASNVVLNAGSYTFAGATNTFSSSLTIASGATLGGSGRIMNNEVITAGTLAPGNSPGTLTFSSNLTLLGSSELVLEIGSNGLDYDRLIVEGTLTKGGTVLVTNLGYAFVGGEVFDFIDATNWAGSFIGLSLPTLTGGMTWFTDDFETKGMLSVIAVPEPSSLLAASGGLTFLFLLRRPSSSLGRPLPVRRA